ncbi:MFS transporter [Bradyrhizobium sp. USDA 4454]
MTESIVDAVAPSVAAPGAVSPRKVFWATWFGWMLDGFDSSMYGYILVSALSELLPASGIEPSKANIGIYGGLLFSIFMLGWACSMVWGWAADRYGRVRIMCWTVLVYSLFTALCGLATGIVMFALFRFVAGFGIGGEWAAGTPLLQESVPENTRVRLAGWLHTATPTGLFLAAAVTLAIGSTLGWRGMFLLGILPALLIAYLRSNIPEPEHSVARAAAGLGLVCRRPGAHHLGGRADDGLHHLRPVVLELLGADRDLDQAGSSRRHACARAGDGRGGGLDHQCRHLDRLPPRAMAHQLVRQPAPHRGAVLHRRAGLRRGLL